MRTVGEKWFSLTNHRRTTCLSGQVQFADPWLEAARAQIQADGERLASSQDQPIYTVQISAMVGVVDVALQITAIDVQNCGPEIEKHWSGL